MAALLFRRLLRARPWAAALVGLSLTSWGSWADPAPDPAVPQPAEWDEALPLLQQYYFNPSALQAVHGGRDLAALLPRLRGVAFLNPPEEEAPPRGELFPGRFGYWRIASLPPKEGNALGAALNAWSAHGLRGLILDLRHCRSGEGSEAFDAVARIASFFLPEGTLLFSVQALQLPQKLYRTGAAETAYGASRSAVPPLVVLTDRATGAAAEVLATVLRLQAGAILIGQSTPGDEALFTFAKLPSGRLLRIPIAPVLLPDGTSLLGTSVVPDIAVYIDDQVQGEVLAQIALGPAAQGLVEAPTRLRLNENALVHQENPEIDEILAEQARAADKDKDKDKDALVPVPDLALMRAVDILKGIALFPSETAPAAVPAPH